MYGAGKAKSWASSLKFVFTTETPIQGLLAYKAGRRDLEVVKPSAHGSNFDSISVYQPAGAQPREFRVAKPAISVHVEHERGQEVLSFRVEANPGCLSHLLIGRKHRVKARSLGKPS